MTDAIDTIGIGVRAAAKQRHFHCGKTCHREHETPDWLTDMRSRTACAIDQGHQSISQRGALCLPVGHKTGRSRGVVVAFAYRFTLVKDLGLSPF